MPTVAGKRDMAVQIFYMKVESKVETEQEEIHLKDIARILSKDSKLQKRAENMVVYRFPADGNRAVISTLTLIRQIQSEFSDSMVINLGECDVVIERVRGREHPVWEWLKIAFISMICFFGAAFTIMAFHNDIDINSIFSGVYEIFTGKESNGFTILEITYSIGLACGIILFFNHIGKRRITKDPTPVEVQMREYEGNVITALVENANRNQEEL